MFLPNLTGLYLLQAAGFALEELSLHTEILKNKLLTLKIKIMKKIDWIITIATLAFSYLFYRQLAGINYLVFTLVLTSCYVIQNPKLTTNRNWVIFTLTSLTSSFFIFWHHSDLAIWAVICSLLLQASYAVKESASVISSGFYAVYSIGGSLVFLILNLIKRGEEKSEKQNSKKGINILIGIGILIIIVVFFFIYKNANPLFEKYTEKINLDFISGAWIVFTLMGFFITYGLLRIQRIKAIDDFEDSILLTLNNSGKISKSFEKPAGIILFIVLNCMLLLINILDVVYLYVLKQLPEGITHTQFVHNGVGMIILSIVLGITIILLLFRNALNFEENTKSIKFLVALWILQNLMMIISTCVRNQIYVSEFNLTYKRIGVFVYLLLACIGLITTLYKVYYKKSNWYLVKTNAAAGILFLCLSASVDWDKLIIEFNIQHKQNNMLALDKKYLLGLSEINIPYLQKIKEHKDFDADSVILNDLRGIDYLSGAFNNDLYNTNSESVDKKTYDFLKRNSSYNSWQSLNKRDQYILSELNELNAKGEIKTLCLRNQELDSLGLLKIFNNVKTMNLSNTHGNHYEFISEYKQLKNLDLSSANIDKSSKLPTSNTLEVLNLSNNALVELTKLNSFPNLKTLNVSSNQFKTLSSIPVNTNIESIDLSNNKQLYNFDGLEKLKALKSINASSIYRIDKFPYISTLETLNLTSVEDISRSILHIPIHDSLKQLYMSYNQSPNLDYLSVHNKAENVYLLRFPTLQILNLADCKLKEAKALQNYSTLEYLDLSNNDLQNISFIGAYEKLSTLMLAGNELESLDFNAKHKSIQYLNLSSNTKLKNFSTLYELSNLKSLDVSFTSFSDLTILTCTNSLTSLDINSCKLSSLDPLLNFKKLKEITIEDLKESDIKIINEMSNLKTININTNRVLSDKEKKELKQKLKNKQINFI